MPPMVTILRPNGTTYKQSALGLRCYLSLVADHERKAQNHRAVYEQMAALADARINAKKFAPDPSKVKDEDPDSL